MDHRYVRVYKGSSYSSLRNVRTGPKTIAFDLDETIGSFGDLYLLWNGIETYIEPDTEPHRMFRELLDLYPEFLRHGILQILEYLLHKKRIGECHRVVLYTNNQCKEGWVENILRYLGDKFSEPIFDETICAYKTHGKITNPLRTTNSKTYSDFITCTMIPRSMDLCFVDNSYYDKMAHDRVYYIQPKSYIHPLSTDEIIDRFISKWSLFELPANFEVTLYEWFLMNDAIRKYDMNETKVTVDITVTQKMMYHLKEYFLLSSRTQKTKKIALNLGRFTRKKKARPLSA